MYRIIFYFFLILSCLSPFSHAADISLDELILGVNQARLTIRSGEVYSRTTAETPAEKNEKEIAAWMSKEKERRLQDFTPDPIHPHVDVKQYEKDHLIPYLNFHANRYRQQTKHEHTTTLFQILEPNVKTHPKLYQYKLTMLEYPGYSLDDIPDRFVPSDVIYLLAYDIQTQVKQLIGNIQHPFNPPSSVRVFDFDQHYGYWRFSLFGRSPISVPPNAKQVGKEKIDGSECHILSFINPTNGQKIHLWVDTAKDFCVRQVEYIVPKTGHVYTRIVYKQFNKFRDIWFPKTKVDTAYHSDKTLRNRHKVEVINAVFNVEFPKNFFQIDRDFYKPAGQGFPGTGLLPEDGTSPTSPAPGTDNLLLLCGPQSLSRVCELLKVDTNLSELKKLSGFNPNSGTTGLGLKEAATYKGLSPTGVKASIELLRRKKVPLPAIAYVNNNHFLVFEAVDDEGVKISDPTQKYKPHMKWDKLSEIWHGDLLIFDKKKGHRTKQKQMPLAFTETPAHDFGKVIGGSKIKHTFTIKNIGQKPLKIISVKETCACTASILSQDEILPGKTGIISTVLTVPPGNHHVRESVLVLTNDPTQNTLALTLKGEAFTPLKTFPELIALENQKPLQNQLTKQVSLHLQKNTQILAVRTDSKHLKASLNTKDGIPHIKVQLLPTLPVGQFAYNVLVDYTYNKEQATHSISVFGEVIGDLRVVPNRLFFGSVTNLASVSKTIMISSRDTQPFKITSVEFNTKAIVVTPKKGEGETHYKLTTTISPTATSGKLSGEIVIHTSSSVQPEVRVPFFGIIAGNN